jgi:hypothetical protein
MTLKHVSVHEDPGGWNWRINEIPDNPNLNDAPKVIARGQAFPNRVDALKSLFSIFFGDYDESFLALYAEFNPEGQFVETQDVGEPVAVQAGFGGEGGMSAGIQQSFPES